MTLLPLPCVGVVLGVTLCGLQAAGIMKRVMCCNAGPTLVGSCDPYVRLGESQLVCALTVTGGGSSGDTQLWRLWHLAAVSLRQ